MNRVLQVVLGVEIALGLFWTYVAATADGAGGLAVVAFFFIIYAIFAVLFLFAAWVFWQRPAERKLAGWIMLLPFIFWFAPHIMRSMSGGALSESQFFAAGLLLIIAAIACCWLFPKKAAAIVPDFLLRSKLVNWLMIIAVIAGWLFFILVIAYVVYEGGASTSDTGEGLGLAIVLAALYLVGLGIGSFGVATWAWLSLRSNIESATRRLNIAQLVVASPAVLIGCTVAFWLTAQGHL